MKNIFQEHSFVTREEKERVLSQRGKVVWFTGLSGSGKSTLSKYVEKKLTEEGKICTILDGDNLRKGVCKDLGFSIEDRKENIRRTREVCKLLINTGIIVLVSLISPIESERNECREEFGKDFIEVYINTPLEICENRDVKGLYKRARRGEIEEFTGISSPFEEPKKAEIIINTAEVSIEDGVDKILLEIIK